MSSQLERSKGIYYTTLHNPFRYDAFIDWAGIDAVWIIL